MSASAANDSTAYPPASGPAALPLREAQTRLSAVLQAVPDLLFMLDGEGRVLDFRAPEPEKLYIPDPNKFVGQKVVDLLPEPAAAVVRHAIAEAAAKGFHRGAVYSMPMPDGEEWYELSIAVQGNLHTEEGRLVAIVRNVTARKRAEDALKESEATRRAINDNLPDGMVYRIETDPGGGPPHYAYVSQGVESLHGVAAAEIMADSGIVYRQILEEDRAQVAAEEARALETMTPFRAEIRVRLPSGEIRWRSFCSAPRRLPNGRVVWDGVEIDVTDRQRAEEALRQSETKYRILFGNMREGFVQGDLACRIQETNLAFRTMTGYSAEELRGMHYQTITPEKWHASEAKILEEQLFSRGYSDLYEKEYVRKDGTVVPIAIRSYLIRDAAGRPTGVWALVSDITARKRAEEALRQSEAKHRVLFESMREGLVQGDLTGRILEANLAFQTLVGYSAEELRGVSYRTITPEKWHALDAKIAEEQVLSRGYSDLYEKEYVRKDGTVVPVLIRTVLMRDAAGQPAGGWALVTDISAWKRAEEARRQSEAKYRLLFENMLDAFVVGDLEGRILECNPAFAQIVGYSPVELRGRSYTDLLPKKAQARAARGLRRLQRAGRSGLHEMEMLRKDGILVPVEHTSTLIRDMAGKAFGMWIVVRDITARKRAEQALRQANEKLEERVAARTADLETSRRELAKSEEQFRQMSENISDAFWLFDIPSQRLLYISPAFERIWGRPAHDLFADPMMWLESVHVADREQVKSVFPKGVPVIADFQIQYRIVRPDGAICWIAVRGWPIKRARGKVNRIAGLTRDITAQHRLEEAILNAGEAERQRIGRDLHDGLGQSLTAIRYMVEALHADCVRAKRPEAAELGKIARLIDRTAGEAHALSHSLLPLDLKRQGLAEALRELAMDVQRLFRVPCRYAGADNVELNDLEMACQLYRIAQEAATNAAKHSRTKEIAIRLARKPTGLLLSVRDTGRGIPPKTGKAAGMGLDIMRYRAGMIGAVFWIDSARRRGTAVNCLIPATAGKETKP